jgi:signal transduction histidine kinase
MIFSKKIDKSEFTDPSKSTDENLKNVSNRLVNIALVTFAILVVPALILSLLEFEYEAWTPYTYAQIGTVILFLVFTALRKKMSFYVKTISIVAFAYSLGIISLITIGMIGIGGLFFLTCIILGTLFFGLRGGIPILGASVLAYTIIGFLIVNGQITIEQDLAEISTSSRAWASDIIAFLFFSGVIVFTAGGIYRTVVNHVETVRSNFQDQLKTSQALENEVALRTKTEKELILTRDKAMSANRSKNDFLMNMSHEIRTPLNVISGLSEIMLDKTENEDIRTNLKNINSNSIKVLSTINTILDLSALETGQFQLHYEYMPITDLTRDIMSIYGPLTKERGIDLGIELTDGFPELIYMDELRFRTIMFNILENSIEFTSEGSIKITVGYADHIEHNKKDIYITVEDTGTGPVIKPSPARSGSSDDDPSGSANYKMEDLDIALSLSEKLARKMKGSLIFQHNPDKGNRFALQLPGVGYKNS